MVQEILGSSRRSAAQRLTGCRMHPKGIRDVLVLLSFTGIEVACLEVTQRVLLKKDDIEHQDIRICHADGVW